MNTSSGCGLQWERTGLLPAVPRSPLPGGEVALETTRQPLATVEAMKTLPVTSWIPEGGRGDGFDRTEVRAGRDGVGDPLTSRDAGCSPKWAHVAQAGIRFGTPAEVEAD